ncbi:MAG: hypothetical protein ABL883_05360 [Terricaulis sp.]
MARAILPLLCLCLAAAGCSGAAPPRELAGLWGAGAASCEAGVGVRFGRNAIEMIYREKAQTLFAHPVYAVLSRGDRFRVRITYELPHIAGGVRGPGGRGIIVLVQQQGGGVAPESHNLIDGRTGAARARISDDPAAALLSLVPCGASPWTEGLRGRRHA